jgi:NADH dehydrogenase
MTSTTTPDTRPHVVILGGGFGGIYAAKELKSAPVRITLVDRSNHHLFQPMLYQVATASIGSNEIASPIRMVLRHQPNAQVTLGEAVRIDAADRRVHLADGRALSYDYLLVATGVRAGYFDHPEWEPLAPGLKTLLDALEIRRRVLLAYERAEDEPDPAQRRAWLTLVVVGAGPTGVELAGALAELKDALAPDYRVNDLRSARVILLDAGPTILPGYPQPLVEATTAALQRLGVEVRTGTRVDRLLPDRVEAGDWAVDTRTVLWAAGVEAGTVLRSLEAPRDSAGRVLVDPDCTVPGRPEVFVIGDAGAYRHPTLGVLPCVCPVAIQQGRYVAHVIRREIGSPPSARRESFADSTEGRTAASDAGHAAGTVERPQFHYWNKGQLAVIGRGRAVCAVGPLRFGGLLAWLVWALVHLYYLVGYRNRAIVLIEWAVFHVIGRHGARIMVGEPVPTGQPDPTGVVDPRRQTAGVGSPPRGAREGRPWPNG